MEWKAQEMAQCKEYCLLLQRTSSIPTPTWQLAIKCNSNSKGFHTFFWSLLVGIACLRYTDRQQAKQPLQINKEEEEEECYHGIHTSWINTKVLILSVVY